MAHTMRKQAVKLLRIDLSPSARRIASVAPFSRALAAASSQPSVRARREHGESAYGKICCAAAAAAVASTLALHKAQSLNCQGAAIRDISDSKLFARTKSQYSDCSIIELTVEKDRPGMLLDAVDVLKKYDLDIREAKITTEGTDHSRAQHIYTVKDKTTGAGLPPGKLEKIQKSLAELDAVTTSSAKARPTYTRAEVEKHKTKEAGIWVTYKEGVYDITDFVVNHPGGQDKIMLAAGKAIDPFWRIYQQHEGRGTALATLEKLRIGNLSDPPAPISDQDPYSKDPDRHPGLIFHNNKPCNAELPSELMMDSWLTPNPVWFIRHHHPVPVIDQDEYRLVIEGEGAKRVDLTLEDIKTRFLKREVVTTIQCGGNRRSELDKVCKTSGIAWGFGAVSTARWGGVYLREVLMHCAGVSLEAVDWSGIKHVVFHGIDDMQASIPIEKALSPYGDVLLAYEMNGEPLPPEHGAPVRVVVPGVVGVRNVKWVGRICTSKVEAEGPWQRGIAYKGFSPMIKDVSGVDLEKILSIQEMPVQSIIVSPKPGTVVELDDVELKGFAWSGGGRSIVRVDVSLDGGKTWVEAETKDGKDQSPTRAWAWTFWEASVPVPHELIGKEIDVLCRATDSSYNTQPERPEPIWNLRGLNCNCWHHVKVQHVE